MAQKIPRDVWLVDRSPADVLRSDLVCEPNESAVATVETLPVSVLFGNKAAVWTCATCVFWVHKPNGNTSEFSLVFDELSELMEAPRVLGATLTPSNRYPRADAPQVFEGDSTLGAFSLRNQPLRDDVVDVSNEARLFSTAFLKQTLSRLGSFALKFSSKFSIAFSYTVNFVSTPSLPIGISGNVFDSKVYSKPFFSVVYWWLRNINDYCKIENAVSEDKVCLSSNSAEPFSLVSSKPHRNNLSTLQRQYRYSVNALPREDALVVNYGSVFLEGWLSFLVSFVGFGYLADGTYGQLSRQAIFPSNVVVDEFLKFHFVSCSLFKRNIGDFVARIVKSLHRFKESFSLFRSRQELHKESLLHILIENLIQYIKVLQFLPPINKWASLERSM